MQRKLTGRTVALIFIVAWALYSMFPLKSGNLVEAFKERATHTDEVFEEIVQRLDEQMAANPASSYDALLNSVGTNDISKYFPELGDVSEEDNPTIAVLNRLQRKIAGRIRLGLDIKGGTSFLVGMETRRIDSDAADGEESAVKEMDRDQRVNALAKAVQILRKRVDSMGVAEPEIVPQGSDRIMISLPGLTEAENEAARRQIERAAFLEFRMVHPQSAELLEQDYIEPGYEVLTETLKNKNRQGQFEESRRYLVKKQPEEGLTGKYIEMAMVHRNPVDNSVGISFRLNSEGAVKFAKVTRENVGRLLAIVLDGELASAPRINSEIPNGSGEITGNFTIEEGIELANTLQNPLESPVKILEERRVDPSLGADSIRSGIVACIISAVLVSLFMLSYYMFAGILANIAVILNIVILLGVMCLIGSTLTIPGIAGIALTVGMAVDANVLIYERIREELAKGKSLRSAVSAGYDRAFGVIFDSNLTTLFAGIIMIMMGSGPVRGFGVTLSIGIVTSMYTALVVTRLCFDFSLSRGKSSLKMLHMIGKTNINFMGWARKAFVLSWVLILVGGGYIIHQGSNSLGVDFKGGDSLLLSFQEKVPLDQMRSTVETAVKESRVGYQKSLSGGVETLSVIVPEDQGEAVEALLMETYPEAGLQRLGLETIGAAIGVEIAAGAIKSLLLTMLAILFYVAMRYEFSFAIGSVVALIHDILMTVALFVITGRQFNAPVIGAMLAIVGFSINNTIVIFDRVREDIKLGAKGSLRDIFNKALNQTLSRTIITSVTVFLAVLSLYLFGGSVINDFAFTFMVGVVVGTWSSLFISSTVVLWITKGRKPNLGSSDVPVEVMDPTVYMEPKKQ
ncbi:MAG: protein translocase subunit SecD [Verrucomicrobiota bacterium]|jgi:SecD/SecF fusion protein|nr:protein translocase subunit SecD [Verrucomicrobiota bacterium]